MAPPESSQETRQPNQPTLSRSMSQMKEKVCLIGSGNWYVPSPQRTPEPNRRGSAIAKIVGTNVARFPDRFDPQVKMVRTLRRRSYGRAVGVRRDGAGWPKTH
jgi:uncharacterized protein involved in type VI secretion and phage assembly